MSMFEAQRRHTRRAIWHDYNGGVYFVTINTKHQIPYFGVIEDSHVALNALGNYAKTCIETTKLHIEYADIPLFVIMPNHIHAIVCIDVSPQSKTVASKSKAVACYGDTAINNHLLERQSLLSYVVRSFKSAVTRFAHENQIVFEWKSRFYDRIVRDQNELNIIAEYIELNPHKWWLQHQS